MAHNAGTGSHSPPQAGTYRVKFNRENFLSFLEVADPKLIYHVGRMYFFAYDGFTMYSLECNEEDFFHYKVIEVIEFSNTAWHEGLLWG